MRFLITGAAGQLSSALRDTLSSQHTVVALDRQALDLTSPLAVAAAIAAHRPDAVLNGAAYNAVDAAEDDVPGAFAVNAFAVRTLARACAEQGAVLVHYSTDFVFDGTARVPYTEADAPRPQSVYAQSKLAGEWFAADCPRHYVLRVESLFGGPARRSSIDLVLDRLMAGTPPTVFSDRIVTPSYVVDVAEATARLLETAAPFGLYHCVNAGMATWVDIGQELARLAGSSTQLAPVRMADLTMKAKRPLYCALSNARLGAAGIMMPTWQDALSRYVAARRIR